MVSLCECQEPLQCFWQCRQLDVWPTFGGSGPALECLHEPHRVTVPLAKAGCIEAESHAGLDRRKNHGKVADHAQMLLADQPISTKHHKAFIASTIDLQRGRSGS